MSARRLRSRFAHWGLLVLVGIGTITTTFMVSDNQPVAAACPGNIVLGRACWRGYFTDGFDAWGEHVLPPITNNQALPQGMIDSADSFVNLLENYFNTGNKEERSGAAFIYNTMLNKNAPGVKFNISGADWNNFKLSLEGLDKAGKINWHGNVADNINSYYQTTNQDDAYYDSYKNETGIEFRDYNNKVIYKILRRCANPIGNSGSGVPPPPLQHYTLTPHVTSVSPTQIEVGSKMTVTSDVDNVGQVASPPTQWEITQINVNPGKLAPHEGVTAASPLAPCQGGGGAASGDYFKDGNSTCKNVAKGSGSFKLGSPSPNIKPTVNGLDIGDLPVGTRVCFALSVQPHSDTDDNWMHSAPVCTVVGKKPKVQVWGGDVAVRGKLETNTVVKDTGVFGSWVEYGAFSVGTNSLFASGSGLNGQTNNSQAIWSNLTFANINNTGNPAFGNYSSLANFPPMSGAAAYFAAIPNQQPVGAASVDLGSLTFATGSTPQVRTAGNLTITGGNIPAGRSVVIIATGTVTIDGNIAYTNAALGSIYDIPQVVIIAKDINIKDSVSQVDSWLVASGTTNTCYNFVGNLTSNKCNVALAVNGPVVTGRLLLNRTAGGDSGAQSGDPAERFNLRPDAYLWAQLEATGNDTAQTVYTTELPPRF
jgi:hypothetical protein